MKKLVIAVLFGCLTISTAYSQVPSATPAQPQAAVQNANTVQQQANVQMARTGCQKALGFFPTPAKIMCVLGAVGKSQNQMKPKELAVIFTVCQGHVRPQPAATAAPTKRYPTMGACLSDPNAVSTINNELTAQGFSAIKVVNPSLLSASM